MVDEGYGPVKNFVSRVLYFHFLCTQAFCPKAEEVLFNNFAVQACTFGKYHIKLKLFH